MHIFAIEGNIGSGKTTFLRQIENLQGDNIQVIYEPVDTWVSSVDSNGKNILDYFYSDMKKFAAIFQTYALATRMKTLDQIDPTKKYIFIERSIFSDKFVFAQNCLNEGLMNEIEMNVYEAMRSYLWDRFNQTITHVYLKTDVETCFNRIHQKRKREEESNISKEYLQKLHNLHEAWLNKSGEIIIGGNENIFQSSTLKKILFTIVSSQITYDDCKWLTGC